MEITKKISLRQIKRISLISNKMMMNWKLKKDSEEPKEMSEAEKKKADELWSNFLKDTKTSTKSTGAALQSSNSNINKYSNCDNSSLSQPIKTSTTNSIKSTIFDSFNSSNDESKKILNESDNSNSETKNNSSNKSNPISKYNFI